MKRFLLLMFILIATWNLVLLLFPHLPKGEEYLSWKFKFDLLKSHDFNGETIILGDSTAEASIKPSYLSNGKAYNLSLPGGTPFEAYLLVKKILENGNKPKKVIIAFGLVNYMFDDGFIIQNINFGLLSPEEIEENLQWQYSNRFIIEDLTHLEKVTRHIPFIDYLWGEKRDKIYQLAKLEYYLSKANLSPIDYSRFKQNLIYRNIDRSEIERNLESMRGHVDYGDDRQGELPYDFARFSGDQFTPHPFSDHYFTLLLDLLSKNSIPSVIEMTPILTLYRSNLSEPFVSSAKDYLKKKANQFNFEHLEDFKSYDKNLFSDFVHVNKKGAVEFSKYLNERYLVEP